MAEDSKRESARDLKGPAALVSSAEPEAIVGPLPGASGANLSTGALLTEIGAQASLLVKKQIELAKVELRADLSHEIAMVGGLSVAAIALLLTVNLLLVAGVFALALVLPGWLAALAVAGFTLLIAVTAGLIGWGKRVRSPLQRTRRALKEDVQWTKERLA